VGQLTSHVLDTARGVPAAGLTINLYRLDDDRRHLASCVTNPDGRCDGPLLEGEDFSAGLYELVFEAGDYFTAAGFELAEPRFLDQIVIRFGIADGNQHYHVPLLVSPYSYSSYRGS